MTVGECVLTRSLKTSPCLCSSFPRTRESSDFNPSLPAKLYQAKQPIKNPSPITHDPSVTSALPLLVIPANAGIQRLKPVPTSEVPHKKQSRSSLNPNTYPTSTRAGNHPIANSRNNFTFAERRKSGCTANHSSVGTSAIGPDNRFTPPAASA